MGSLSERPLWIPGKEVVASTRLESLRKTVNKKYSLQLESYADLHKWSVTQRSNFWTEVWNIGEIIHSEPYTQVVDESLQIDAIPKWFIGAKLNFAENLLEKGIDDDIAVYYKGEGHPTTKKLTYAQLRKEVSAWSSALKSLGVTKGDVVAGILPNCIETLCAVLATASIGAVWTCTSPDYGTLGVVERFKQTEPKVVISVNAVFYNGKTHGMREKLETIVSELTSVKHVIVIPFFEAQNEESKTFSYENWIWSSDLLDDIRSSKVQILYEQVTSDHPLFIMYSSGTTGTPKCLVHSVGGTLLKHVEEHLLQSDLRNDDVIFYYTTIGWMMYNWLISSLISGCSIVLYDGAPTAALWSLIDELGITIFGTSAKWLSVQEEVFLKNSAETGKSAKDLDKNRTKLRMVLSTGSPLKPQSFDFIYNYIKKDVVVGSISGGTDIVGCFMGQNMTIPVHCGEIQSYHLGCDLDCVDENGKSVIGERGELVVRSAFPSMPTHFHNDQDGILYKKAYFNKFPGVWAHGDFMLVSSTTKGIVMLGRSDCTLNPSGVRFGSAEIYQIVEQFNEISDSVCVGQRNKSKSDERVVLFLKLVEGNSFTNELTTSLKKAIRENLSPRHVPSVILPVAEIPYTISGKKVEIAVRNVIEGEQVKNKGALANPQSLDCYQNIAELAAWS
ncbi:Acetoacetyl-CoA synthetase [Orchesella cincta]|uniref:Acetoacetyl-CoA synthetase n=1 Tax=Orchesella cincta TaxID=48709 RepID=A0A1D2MSG6_ORCCI|nr:Acetoacetyl-CoA synthetase [Orchesella cincta]